jgi:hypothetical protein
MAGSASGLRKRTGSNSGTVPKADTTEEDGAYGRKRF